MKLGYWKGYSDGYREGQLHAVQELERVLAILREELVDQRAARDAQSHRADAACDLLLGHLGARAISLEGEKRESERADRHVKAVQTLTMMPDPTDDLPIGHPMGTFKSDAEAARALSEDIEGLMNG